MSDEDDKIFDKLVSDKESRFSEHAEERKASGEWEEVSAGIIFMLLDFMKEQKPKITQKALSVKWNVSAQYVSKLLHGKENLTLQTVGKIADFMGISMFNLFANLSNQVPNENVQVVDKEEDTTEREVFGQLHCFKVASSNENRNHLKETLQRLAVPHGPRSMKPIRAASSASIHFVDANAIFGKPMHSKPYIRLNVDKSDPPSVAANLRGDSDFIA